jgi:transposase-like protein
MTLKRTCRRYTAEFKAEVATTALTEHQSLDYQLAPAQIMR